MNDLDELIFIQIIYIAFLYFIIRGTLRQGRKATFYWIVIGIYAMVISWLAIELINMNPTGNGGYGFAIGMYSIIIPGILVFTSVMVYCILQGIKNNSKKS
jgi:apolipoprotein N-acyltransferase